jgi:hypothetical protein
MLMEDHRGVISSQPALPVENDNSALVGKGSQLILLVRHVLKGIHAAVVYHRAVVPEPLGVRKGRRVVVLDSDGVLLGPNLMLQCVPVRA